jgi:hypothetical protein
MLPLLVPAKLSLALVLFEVAAASVVAAVVPAGEPAAGEAAAA